MLNVLDDHSRLLVASAARLTFKAADVVEVFHDAAAHRGFPSSLLTDNGAVFTAVPRGGGRCAIELECDMLGVRLVHSRPYHPQTCGKVERLHQTLKRWLAKQPAASDLTGLQASSTVSAPTTTRSDRTARSGDARPSSRSRHDPEPRLRASRLPRTVRIRHDRIDGSGAVTLRHDSRLHHIKVGRRYARTRVLLLVAGLDVRIVSQDGELLRELILDPSKSYQAIGRG